MIRARIFGSALAVVAVWSCVPVARAADPPDLFLNHLDDFIWNGSGDGTTWQSPANWTAPAAHPGEFPDDPGRIDDGSVPANVTTIISLEGANLSIAQKTDLTVNINGSDVTVASLKLGGTSATNPITTNVTSSTTNKLVFENNELNDNSVPTAVIYSFNQNRSLIWSTGTVGVGKENRISAGVKLNDDVDVEGDRDVHIYGDILEGETNHASSINSLLTNNAKLYIHGNINTVRLSTTGDPDGITTDRIFGLNSTSGQLLPLPNPVPANASRQATIDFTGKFTGNGLMEIGSPQETARLPLGSVILHGDSTGFTGRIYMNRGNIVLDNDKAFGEATFVSRAPTQNFGMNLISTDDSRTISNFIDMSQWQTVRTASSAGLTGIPDSSIKFTGKVAQNNTRGWINLLPADTNKTLTLSGPQYPLEGGNNRDGDRIYTIDGSGKTIISGGIHNRDPDNDGGAAVSRGSFRVRGTGSVYIDYDETNMTDAPTDYAGYTFIEGGSLHFRTSAAIGSDSNGDLPSGAFISRGGAVGVDDGVIANTTFLSLLNNSSNPNSPDTPNFFLVYGNNEASILTKYCEGGLMLGTIGTNEYTQNLDFNTAPLSNAANMSLAAQEGGSQYTGTITPKTTLAVNPNTYQLGGGGGTLTLPNANQLTGARNLLVTNGGEVALTNTNNYTGTTRIVRKYLPSNQDQAKANIRAGGAAVSESDDPTTDTVTRTTLTVTTLANGGSPSSIGSSSNAAGNLIVQDSILKYTGGEVSTDRLFTVGTAGGTIDASGGGAVNFTNTGSVGIQTAAPRTGITSPSSIIGGANNEVFGLPSASAALAFNTEDLVPGMRITSPRGDFTDQDHINAGVTPSVVVTSIESPHVIRVAQSNLGLLPSESDSDANTLPNRWTKVPQDFLPPLPTMSFGPAPQRVLTLQGGNQDNNTIAAVIGNASDIGNATAAEASAGYGRVAITKRGIGKWVLTGNNSYSGPTNVEQGTLFINGTQTGTGRTTVSAGAILGGTGTLGGSLVNNGTVAPGASAGTLTVTGNYTQWGGATLAVELGGTGAGAFDVLNVLAGTPGTVQGDYNGNGTVDSADYELWRDTLGSTTNLTANGDNNGASANLIDQADFTFWKNHFGETTATGTAALLGTIKISLINSFNPSPGQMFTILTAANGVNAEGVTLSGQSAGFHLILNPNSIVLNYTGAGSGGAAGNVPEPGSLVMAVMALVGLCGCVRRLYGR